MTVHVSLVHRSAHSKCCLVLHHALVALEISSCPGGTANKTVFGGLLVTLALECPSGKFGETFVLILTPYGKVMTTNSDDTSFEMSQIALHIVTPEHRIDSFFKTALNQYVPEELVGRQNDFRPNWYRRC